MSWLPDWITGYDAANAQKAAEADAQIRAINQAKIDSGQRDAAWAAQVNKDFASQEVFGVDNQRAAIDSAFVSGLNDGRNSVKDFFNNVVWQFLKSIPFVVWIGLAVALFVWLGGLSLLKGRLARSK